MPMLFQQYQTTLDKSTHTVVPSLAVNGQKTGLLHHSGRLQGTSVTQLEHSLQRPTYQKSNKFIATVCVHG